MDFKNQEPGIHEGRSISCERFHPWGKLSREQPCSWHPLLDHMTDVAACFLALAECSAIRRSLEKTAGRPLDAADVQRLAVLVFLHDVGKANAGFQAKRWVAASQPVPPGWPAPAGHTHEALCIFSDETLLIQLPVDEMDTWGSACLSLWRASISHHGRPVEESSQVDTRIWRPVISAGQVVYDPQATLCAALH